MFPPENLTEIKLQALRLRRRGKSYCEIADELGISMTTAYRYVLSELKRVAQEHKAEGEYVLGLELERLDRLLLAVMEKAEAGSLDHIDTVIRLSERRAKLLGLNAPTHKVVEHEDRRELPDAEVWRRTQLLVQKLAEIGHPGAKALAEGAPIIGLIEGQVVEKPDNLVAAPGFSAPNAENGAPGSSENNKMAWFDEEPGSEHEPGDQNE